MERQHGALIALCRDWLVGGIVCGLLVLRHSMTAAPEGKQAVKDTKPTLAAKKLGTQLPAPLNDPHFVFSGTPNGSSSYNVFEKQNPECPF